MEKLNATIYRLSDSALRVFGPKPSKTIQIIAIVLIVLTILAVYLFRVYMISGMMKKTGAETRAEYKAYKQDCQFNFKNRLCISDEWVINEYSLRVYPTADLISAEMRDKGYLTGAGRFSIRIILTSGSDWFNISNRKDCEYIVRNINEYDICRQTGTVFVQENYK